MAMRLERPDLASASLDAAVTAPGNRGDFGRMKEINARRLALVDRLDDPFELGDIYSMNAWCDSYIGDLEIAREYAQKGVDAAGDSPTVLGCLSWLAFAEFRLGNWDRMVDEIQPAIEHHLGERSNTPPHFTVPAFGAAAFVLDSRAAPTAERYVSMLRSSLGTQQGYSTGMVDGWLSLIEARRGNVDEARAILGATSANVRRAVTRPFLDTAAAYVLAAASAWGEADGFVEETRPYAKRARLVALPASLDRLEGLVALARGDADRALELLVRASDTFGAIDARWDRAVADLDLAACFAARGDQEEARRRLASAADAFERVRSVRDLERVRAIRMAIE
jgi:tetratricopeptide (TPR) repeat protein